MKTHYAVVLVAVVVAVLFVFAVSQGQPAGTEAEKAEEPSVGLGISHYDLSNVTVDGETRLVAARLINTGTLDLNVTVVWTQNNGALLRATVEPEFTLLKADESIKVYLTVQPEQAGVYVGVVEIQASRASSEGGNQVVSGGSIDARITAI